eukprot:CAMPEP_0201488678 /NCGR_PEP_ID=MMETSP0151_2-20130828/19316_1 /ASSEMBLY_ACC=CAM_ASM_000257 /TAXON_ID=200890 /ORGANISM="Paramoeba atlantica, Strain 621/1 / CCAP 1560/9" /LENGTH=321 /DNA_ID=CAMNT_0047874021 /DNA_START=41 /DNA_END=1006 /DNA_ORIENTATION=+
MKLKIKVNSATGLANTDKGGASDPYAIVYINGKEVARTKTIKDCLNPVWNETFNVEVSQLNKVKVHLFDKDTLKDDSLGWIKGALKGGKLEGEKYVTGEVDYEIFLPDEPERSEEETRALFANRDYQCQKAKDAFGVGWFNYLASSPVGQYYYYSKTDDPIAFRQLCEKACVGKNVTRWASNYPVDVEYHICTYAQTKLLASTVSGGTLQYQQSRGCTTSRAESINVGLEIGVSVGFEGIASMSEKLSMSTGVETTTTSTSSETTTVTVNAHDGFRTSIYQLIFRIRVVRVEHHKERGWLASLVDVFDMKTNEIDTLKEPL